MLEGITNTVVMVFFGLFIGALVSLFSVLSKLYSPKEQPRVHLKKRAGEGFRNYLRRQGAEADERAEQTRKEMATAPRSFKILYATLVAFIVIVVVIINFTPLRMNWIAFLSSAFVAAVTAALIYDRTKKGKI